MWPSDNKVKNTLCHTGVLLFRDGNLQLNPNIDLAKTILEKELLISAIDTLNATFDQEEKLKLAVLLRDYIYVCRHLEQLQLAIQRFWKNHVHMLKRLLWYPSLFLVVLILSPLILPIKWLGIKFSVWSEEKKQIKNRENLKLRIEEANQSNLINPLTIDYDSKLFKIPDKEKIPEVANLSIDELIENLAQITGISSKKFKKHIGPNSTYTLKNDLKEALQLIYYRLKGDFDRVLGPIQEKAALTIKLEEGINNCSEGFHNRVNTIVESFNTLTDFTELLYLVRKSLIEKTAVKLMQDHKKFRINSYEIHTYNDFTRIAHQEGLGVPLGTDNYRGDISWDAIRVALQVEFENSYTLFNLPTLLTAILQEQLIEAGYRMTKEKKKYSDSEVDKFVFLIKKFLSSNYYNTHWEFFIFDDEITCESVVDINWEAIKTAFLKQLIEEKYFKLCSEEDFSQYFLELLTHIKSTNNNYFTLLAQIQPIAFYLLFHRLEEANSKEMQKEIINLLFKKDKMGITAIQLIAQNNPEILERFFRFIDSDSCNQKLIQTFLIEKNDMVWDSFVYASEKQPKSAFIFLNYIIQHPEMFKPDTHETCLFLENLSKIQHGLSNLMAKRRVDLVQKTTLLRFLSSYPAALSQSSKKIIDFLFFSLSSIEDEQLIKELISKHSELLLKNFSVNDFKNQNKNLALIVEKLLEVYDQELTGRKNTSLEYTTQFFNCSFGYSASEKLKALTAIKAILNNKASTKQINQLNKAKSDYPALSNGRLSHLFKACTRDIEIRSQIKIQPQV